MKRYSDTVKLARSVTVPPRRALIKLAAEADCDPRTIGRMLSGRTVESYHGLRIAQVLLEHGLIKDADLGDDFEAVDA